MWQKIVNVQRPEFLFQIGSFEQKGVILPHKKDYFDLQDDGARVLRKRMCGIRY